MSIHATALVSSQAEIDPSAEIGPYVVIEGKVRIGARSRVLSHACLFGETEIGEDNIIHPFAVIGHDPQDLSYRGEPTSLVVGHGNTFREGCSVHRGTPSGGGTVVGNDNFLMANSHIGHDCRVGDSVILANGVLLGGHVRIADHAFISGNVVIHQFCRVGRHAMLGGASGYSKDVLPFCTGSTGKINQVMGLNVIGLRRAGFDADQRREIKDAYRTIYLSGLSVSQALAELDRRPLGDLAREMVEFVRASRRGICRHAR